MAGNTIGQLFCVTTFGESHGIALGCIVDGVPPNLELSEADIQPDLDRRKPGTSRYTTPRRENDELQILSGVFEGKTTGTTFSIENPHIPAGYNKSLHYHRCCPILQTPSKGMSIEAEVGSIGGVEDGVVGNGEIADPAECAKIFKLL